MDLWEEIEDNDSVASKTESQELYQDINNEKRWRLSYLKRQFESLALDKLFGRYLERISHGYFSQFLSLQVILITAHFITLTIVSKPSDVRPDLTLYGLIAFLSVILLILTDTYVKRYHRLLKYFAGTAFVMVFLINYFIPFYYINLTEPPPIGHGNLRPAYTTYLIICSYILLNVHNNNILAFVMGISTSVFHALTLIFVTYRNSDNIPKRVLADSVYLLCINGLGLYFRYMNEIVIRRSFLDRRSCVVSTNQLQHEQKQESQLMLSIIPSYILDPVKKSHLLSIRGKQQRELHILHHDNVTILFADIVNYTAMTTKLKIEQLLQTLNELFGRFDDASEELNVLRIKFLGDCYYCVAGLPPNPAPNHAEACVDLGLKMIDIIADVRNRKDLDINMRIGIHTGKITSGVIGAIKWQYDIWSSDVDRANCMETEGEAGKVHITQETRHLLKKHYNMESTSHGTFLISPTRLLIAAIAEETPELVAAEESGVLSRVASAASVVSVSERRPTLYIKKPVFQSEHRASNGSHEQEGGRRFSGNPNLQTPYMRGSIFMRQSTDRRLTHGDGKRRTAFMNSNIKRYKEGLEKTNNDLKETIEQMKLTKFEQWFQTGEMNRVFLTFQSLKREISFITTPDPLFKYYLLCEVFLLLLVYIIENLTLQKWDWPSWLFFLTLGIIVFILLPICWTHHIWTRYANSNKEPKNKIILFFYELSVQVTQKFYLRLIIYFMVYVLFCLCVISEWVQCEKISMLKTPYNLNKIERRGKYFFLLSEKEDVIKNCIVPWHMTETCALAIIMSFLFLRMHMFIKLLFASLITIIYSICVWYYSNDFYGDSQTFNYTLKPEVSHTLSVVFLTVTLHLVDRQTEYMNRLDYGWYESLIDKQQKASQIRKENNQLLKNILPIHVAEIYLNLDRNFSEDLYRESYDNVAVVFASIINYDIEDLGGRFLSVMNTIIKEFDILTVDDRFGRPIEKIKIAKWTYMAACGLDPGFGDSRNIELDQTVHPVIALLKFASTLMQKLHDLNRENKQDMKLRVGISHGPLAAGVVGSRKPLYDIWGDPVNMASRMDTTGSPNRIQVLQDTASVIQFFGYACEYRGLVKVKGRPDDQHTYFVVMDKDFNLVKMKNGQEL